MPLRPSLTFRRNIVRTLLVWLADAFLLVVYLRPKSRVPTVETIGIVLLVNLFAFLLSYYLTDGGRGRTVLRVLITPAIMAVVIVFLLVPLNDPGLDVVFLVLFFIELVGQLAAWIVIRR